MLKAYVSFIFIHADIENEIILNVVGSNKAVDL